MSARSAVRALSAIGVGAGAVTVLTTYLPTAPHFRADEVRWIGLGTIAIALTVLLAPWRRLPLRATLALVPVALTLIACHNVSGGSDPFRYGLYFVVLFVWIGSYHPRGTSLWWALPAAVAYVVPLLLTGAPTYQVCTVGYAVPLYVGIGEVLASRSTALVRSQARLRHLAEHDPLTGLANRALFLAELDRALAAGRPAVVYVDLDDFKRINDGHGHAVGDDVLCRAAAAISSAVREGDLVARLAGDEFAVLLPDVPPEEDGAARLVADRVLERLHEVGISDGVHLRASAGLALGFGTRSDDLLVAADTAMYHAKRHGKDAVVLATAELVHG